MLIEYKTTRSVRDVSDVAAQRLIKSGIARPVYRTKVMTPEPVEVHSTPKASKKKQYKRRDMKAEE